MARFPHRTVRWRQALLPPRRRARLGVLAVVLIAAAGITPFVLGQQVPAVPPLAHASPSSSPGVPLAALLRQGTPDTAPGYWEKPVA